MAFNVRPGGQSESVPVVSTVVSGDVVRIGHLTGVAQISAELSDRDGLYYTTLALEGIANAQVAGALNVGQPVYTSTAAPAGAAPGVVATLTATATAGFKLVGIATRAKGAGTGMAWFKLIPGANVAPA